MNSAKTGLFCDREGKKSRFLNPNVPDWYCRHNRGANENSKRGRLKQEHCLFLHQHSREMKHSSASDQCTPWSWDKIGLFCSLLVLGSSPVQAWGSNNHVTSELSNYGNKFDNDWMNSGSTLSFQVEGCAWGYVYDSEESGCLEDESEEGTTNWYMMANCRRPQVAFSVFEGSSCSSGNFVGSVC